MRRLSLLAGVSAALSLAILLAGGLVAGLTSGRTGTAMLAVLAAVFLIGGLLAGWRPGLIASSCLLILAGMSLPNDPSDWTSITVLALTALGSHEAARLSIDLRRPTRLGPRVLSGFAMRAALIVAGVLITGVAVRGIDGIESLPAAWFAVGIAAIGIAPALPRLTAIGHRLDSVGTAGRVVLGVGLCAMVLTLTSVGAVARQGLTNDRELGADTVRGVVDDLPSPAVAPSGPQEGAQLAEVVATLVLFALLLIIVALVFQALRRPEIPLDQDDVEFSPDDEGLYISAPAGADLSEGLETVDEDVAADLVNEILIDLRSEPDPGRAVRFAYARIEQSLAENGAERRPAESVPEFIRRALSVLGPSGSQGGDALTELTGLFERARFSESDVPEAMRESALSALDTVRARLDMASQTATEVLGRP
ncbi:MAG: DUF4129 domain-containing protein [Actinomycetia bacterium]|nr:DUF4129 domain-containing protein [Actinomycetes bacterium]